MTARNRSPSSGSTNTPALLRAAQEAEHVCDPEDHHVGLRLRIDRKPELLKPLGEAPRVRVVLGQPRDVVIEREVRRRGENARLSHAAAEHLAQAPRAVDRSARAAERGADRRPEPLREAGRDGVEAARPVRGRDAARDLRVEEPRAVEVRREPGRTRDGSRRVDLRPAGRRGRRDELCVFSIASSVVGARCTFVSRHDRARARRPRRRVRRAPIVAICTPASADAAPPS